MLSSSFAVFIFAVIFVRNISASLICDATVLCHISLYRRFCSSFIPAFSTSICDGRMASWASWAFLLFLAYVRNCKYSFPYFFSTTDAICPRAVWLKFVLSVLIYVICPASYSLWAMDIVRDGAKPRRELAVC